MLKPNDTAPLDVSIIHHHHTAQEDARLRQANGWPVLDSSVYERAAAHSLFAVSAVVNGEVVGAGRITGDGALWAYIQDMLVLPEYQGRGIGRRLMEELLAFLERTAPKGCNIALVAAPGKSGFYAKFGFELFPADKPGMRRRL
jgi:GNAT superfamily N-acetyltransferase